MTNMAATKNTHGYDADFLPELDNKYQCPVCLAALRDPVQTRCGHRFCKSCLTKTFKLGSVRFSKCPVDNTWIDTAKEIFVDMAVKREVLSLTVACCNKTEGCEWTGELRNLQKHETSCPSEPIKCPNNCKKIIQRRHLEEHGATCPLRMLSCPHCSNSVVFQDITKHQVLVCMKFPVNCTVCGETGILRQDIPQHVDLVSGNCPLVTVKCAFCHIGCYFQDKRKNMTYHYREAYHQHMVMLACKLMQHEEVMQRQKLEIREATETCARLSNLTQQQQSLLEEQQRLLSSHTEDVSELRDTSYNGKLMWKIDLGALDPSCTSQAFYTGHPGYKFRLGLERRNNMVNLSVELVSGKHDESLLFPISCTCRVALIGQSKKKRNYVQNVMCQRLTPSNTERRGSGNKHKETVLLLTYASLTKFSSKRKLLLSAEIHFQ